MNPVIRQHAEFTAPFEGFSSVVYADTKGIKTIAYGFNLERADARARLSAVGLDLNHVLSSMQSCTRGQGLELMEADLADAFNQATLAVPGLMQLPGIVRLITVDLVYNLGAGRFRKFPGFLSALNGRDWATAAAELMFSRVGEPRLTGYFEQVKTRAQHHVSALLKLHKDRTP